MSDRVAVIDKGRFRQIGTPARYLRAAGEPLHRRVHRRIASSCRSRCAAAPRTTGDRPLRLAEPPRHPCGRAVSRRAAGEAQAAQAGGERLATQRLRRHRARRSSTRARARCSTSTWPTSDEVAIRQPATSAVPALPAPGHAGPARPCRQATRSSCPRSARHDRDAAPRRRRPCAATRPECTEARPPTARRGAARDARARGARRAGPAADRRRRAGADRLAVLAVVPHADRTSRSSTTCACCTRSYTLTLQTTFELSFLVTAICIALGYPLAYLIAQARPRIAALLLLLVLFPVWTSLLVRCYAWLVLLQRRGVVNTWLTDMGLIDTPLQAHAQLHRHHHRHGAHHAAVHGAAALRARCAPSASRLHARRGEPRRLAGEGVLAHVRAALAARAWRPASSSSSCCASAST